MKLTPSQIEDAEVQLNATAVEDDFGLIEEFQRVWGDHTYFFDPDGLHILEWFDEDQPADRSETLTVVRVAVWTDERMEAITTQPPQKTETFVVMRVSDVTPPH